MFPFFLVCIGLRCPCSPTLIPANMALDLLTPPIVCFQGGCRSELERIGCGHDFHLGSDTKIVREVFRGFRFDDEVQSAD